jgi:hypothetical protein
VVKVVVFILIVYDSILRDLNEFGNRLKKAASHLCWDTALIKFSEYLSLGPEFSELMQIE